jgi:hypothetical protein
VTKSRSIVELITLSFGFAANARFLSGTPGIESVPGPKLPEIDFLNRFNGLILDNLYYNISIENPWLMRQMTSYCSSFPEENQRSRRSTRKMIQDSNHLPCSKNT